MVQRRRLLASACLLSLTVPTAFAQVRAKAWRVGLMTGISRPEILEATVLGGFVQGMRELGYVDGKNLALEWRFAEGRYERFDGFAREFVALKTDAIVVGNTAAAHAAKAVTTTIPIVLGAIGDPVAAGLVPSLARPGGNITGLSQNAVDIVPKSLELLKAVLPKAVRIALLYNPRNEGNAAGVKSYQEPAALLGLQLHTLEATTLDDIDRRFGALARSRPDALIVMSDALFLQHRQRLLDAALKARLPSLVEQREYTEAGGLMSFGQSLRELFRRAATYVDRIFKGAEPANLPIEQPNLFELVINMKTARALGVSIPSTVLARADHVIE